MEGPLVSVSMGVMKRLLAKLTKLLEEEYYKLRGVSKQIKFLRDELRAMTPALEMLGDAQELSPLTRYWRDELRELAYDMEDCVDNFMARADHEGGEPTGFLWSLFQKFKKLVTRHEIADEIEELKNRVMEVSERHKRYNFVELTSKSSSSSAIDPRLPALYEEIDRLVGIGEPKKEIIELLAMERNGSSTKFRVVSIVGCGGLGKTTLAKQVYDTVKSQFSCAAFVSVSQSPDVMKILKDIANGVGLNENTLDDDEKQLIDKLRERLKDERYLVVLDDVWDTDVWKLIKPALTNSELGSRIVTTTRNTTIALSFSSQGDDVYQMKPLSFNYSKTLLFKRAFGSEDLSYTHLGNVPDELLRKCDGLPLAIITISSILTDQHAKSEWDRVLNNIGSALARNPGAGTMTTILSLSYFDIPSHLRTCLLYLSMFPEDYVIKKQHLINRWVAEGFVHEEEGRTKYDIGEGYFNDLINRSMIQPVDVKYGQAKACRVHDIILDYINCKAAEENFVTSLDAAEHVHTSGYKVRRTRVNKHTEENVTIWTDTMLSHVRSVSIFGQCVKTSLFPSTALRVLDLGDCRGMEDHHLASIENLFHLKYLHLSSRSIYMLPEKIGELRYLQTLDVQGTRIKELPSTITKLQQLAHLYVDEDVSFPDGMIGEMHCLEEVSEYGVQSFEQGKSLQEFSKLTKLRTLKIKLDFDSLDGSEGLSQAEDCHINVGTLLSSCNLHNLHITYSSDDINYPLSLDSWHPATPCSLRKLWIKNCGIYKVPNWMDSLGDLVVLKLYSILCLRPEDVEILGAIPSLLFLKLETFGGTNGRIIVQGSDGFRSLKYFSMCIYFCGTALEFQVGSMPNLEHLKLTLRVHEGCLNGASSLGIQHLSALSKVDIVIRGNCMYDSNYDATEDKNGGTIRYVASAINSAIMTHPNRPTVRFETVRHPWCEHFDCHLKKWNQEIGGVLTEWFKIWQIDEMRNKQEVGKDDTYEEDEVERADEKGVEQHEGQW